MCRWAPSIASSESAKTLNGCSCPAGVATDELQEAFTSVVEAWRRSSADEVGMHLRGPMFLNPCALAKLAS
jgi:hypothetical protein